MIISYEHRLIFLKTRKTGGTSAEIALSRYTGDRDVVTRISPADEVTRRERGYRGPQHDVLPARRYRPVDLARAVRRRQPLRAYNHMPAAEVRRWFPAEWADYRKLTIVRDPHDAVVSHYFWKTRSLSPDTRPTLAEFLRSDAVEPLTRNWRTYTLDDVVVADHVCRFERLADDLAAAGRDLDLPGGLDLPNAKGGSRRDRRDPHELLSDADAAVVQRLFARELETFGYRW